MYPINFRRQNPIHLEALVAPRPLLMAHGTRDLGFPVEGYREFERAMAALYRDCGAPEAFRNLEVETDHADSDYLQEQALLWFDRYLGGQPARKLEMGDTELPEAALSVFDGKPPRDAQNFRVHESFTIGLARAPCRNPAEWRARGAELLTLLRDKVFTNLNPPAVPERIETRRGAFFEEVRVGCADGVDVRMLLRHPARRNAPVPGLLYIASPGEDAEAIRQLLHPAHLRDASVRLAVYPRGSGETSWNKTAWKAIFRNAMLAGLTVDEMRLADVLTGLEVLRRQPGVDEARLTVLGRGVSGALGLYAAILQPAVNQVLLMEPPATHREGPIFLNVLRYTDLPEATALLVPRRLGFYARFPAAFDLTREIYASGGSPTASSSP